MDRIPSSFDAEALTRQTDSLRNFVRALVRDPHSVDDVLQETWIVAFNHRGGVDSEGRWLRGVAQRIASRLGRSAMRRRHYERDAAQTEVAVQGCSERIEVLRTILHELDQLDEVTRRLLSSRYLDGEPPRVIAQREGMPVATVKSRLKRGLAMLRARMDGHFDGRAAWCALLIPKQAKAATAMAFPLGGLIVMKVALTAVAAVTMMLLWLNPFGDSSDSDDPHGLVSGSTSREDSVAREPADPMGDALSTVRGDDRLRAPVVDQQMPLDDELTGRLIVTDPEGGTHEGLDGELVYQGGSGEASIPIRRGSFLWPEGQQEMQIIRCRAGGNEVLPLTRTLTRAATSLDGVWIYPVWLHVIAEETGAELTDVLVRSEPSWRADGKAPGVTIQEACPSPVQLTPIPGSGDPKATKYYVRARDHAWTHVTINHLRPGERRVVLVPSGQLEIIATGDLRNRDIRAMMQVESGLVVPGGHLDNDGVVRLSGLPLGNWTVELQENAGMEASIDLETKLLGRKTITLASEDNNKQLRFDISSPPPSDRIAVTVSGSLELPAEWSRAGVVLHVQGPAAGRPGLKTSKIPITAMTKIDDTTFAWESPSSASGIYHFRVAPMDHRITREIPSGGSADISLEVPAPGVLTVEVVDAETANPVAEASLDFTPFSEGDLEDVIGLSSAQGAGGKFRVRVPRGKIDLFVSSPGYASSSEVVDVRSTTQSHRVLLERETGITYVVMEDGRPLPEELTWAPKLTSDIGRVTTRSAGRMLVDHPGSYRFSLTAPRGFKPVDPIDVVIERGKMHRLEVHFVPID